MEQLLKQLIGKIQALTNRGITRTEFFTLAVPYTPNVGIPIGQGACKAVVLKVNSLIRNSDDAPIIGTLYYGDSKSQERELIGFTIGGGGIFSYSNSSDVIFCTDLSQVFVRQGLNGLEVPLQVIKYY